MSKLVDKLRKISHGEIHRMGFGSNQTAGPKIPVLGMVASIPGPNVEFTQVALQGGADAVLIRVRSLADESDSLKEALAQAGDIPCGVELDSILPEDVERLVSIGADFLVLHTETAPSAFLRAEGAGKVAAIDPYLEASLLRTLDQLAVDVILIDLAQGNQEFLTIREVMACRRTVDLVRKPAILRISSKLSTEDLGAIRDLGIESVLIDLNGPSSGDVLSRLRQAIDQLPPRQKKREGLDALLPRQTAAPKPEPEDDEL